MRSSSHVLIVGKACEEATVGFMAKVKRVAETWAGMAKKSALAAFCFPILASLLMSPSAFTIGFLSFVALPVCAQVAGAGAIEGRITDATKAVIPGAKVTATNEATGVKTIRVATGAGVYQLSPLPAGHYTVSATAQGFASAVQEHVTVDATQTVGLDLTLKVGSQNEAVTVTAAPPALDTTDAMLSTTLENREYSALPVEVNGSSRSPLALALLLPGVTTANKSDMQSYNGGGGSQGRVNDLYVDGVPVGTTGNTQPISYSLTVDAVNQFQVITSGAPAQYSGMGAQNFDVKSGTSQFHGLVADYVRNTFFDSWGFFSKAATVPTASGGTIPAPKPVEHQNELSMTLGGPILRDKLFFFVAYNRYHSRKGGSPALYTIPTPAELQGDFTALPYKIYDPTTYAACTAANNGVPCAYQFDGDLNGVPTPNVIPANEISPQAAYMAKFLPKPTSSGLVNNYLGSTPSGNDNWMFDAKVDYHPTQKQTLSFLYFGGHQGYFGLASANGLPAPYTTGFKQVSNAYNAIVEDTYVLSPVKVNSLKYGYTRTYIPTYNPWDGISQYEASAGVGIGNLPAGEASSTFPNVSFGGIGDDPTSWPSKSNASSGGVLNDYSLVDDFQWTAGKHNLTFGMALRWIAPNQASPSHATAPLSLSFKNVNTAGYSNGLIQNTTTGNSIASFLIGAVNSSGMTVYPYTMLGGRYKDISPSFEDMWRVNSKLTLNLGLRWDLFTPFHEVQNRWSFLNPDLQNPATGNLGAMQFAGYGPYSCDCRTPVHTYWGNLGPRIAAAYSLNSRTVLRGAYSIMYTNGGGVDGATGAYSGTGQAGFTGSATFPASGQSGAIPAFYLNAGLPAPYANTSLPAFTSTNNVTPDRSPIVNAGNYIDSSGTAISPKGVSYADPRLSGRAPYAEYWNIGIQRALTNNLTVEADYAASASHFLWGASSQRGYYSNEMPLQYNELGPLLKQLPGSIDAKTGQSYLAEAQAIDPSVALPYGNFGGPSGTIGAMLKPFPQYGGIDDMWGDVANARYNSIQLKLTQRSVHGLSYSVNYTYNQERDTTGTFRTGYDIPAAQITDGIARRRDQLEYTAGTTETPNILRAYGVWDMPFGRNKGSGAMWLVNQAIRGWAFSGTYSYHSGTPLAITGASCAVIGQGTCMPSYNTAYKGNPRIHGKWGKGITTATAGTTPYIDASAFTVVNTTYQLGNIPRTGAYNLFGPSAFNIDSSLRRTFKVTERVNFIFDAEVFNLTNTPEFKISSLSVKAGAAVPGQNSIGTNSGSSFATLGSQANSPRDWQFAGRITF